MKRKIGNCWYVSINHPRSTPLANEIITYDFLQQYVEANGGGNGIAEFNQVFNGRAYMGGGNATLPSGGSWLVLEQTEGVKINLRFVIRAGGYTYRSSDYEDGIGVHAVRIA